MRERNGILFLTQNRSKEARRQCYVTNKVGNPMQLLAVWASPPDEPFQTSFWAFKKATAYSYSNAEEPQVWQLQIYRYIGKYTNIHRYLYSASACRPHQDSSQRFTLLDMHDGDVLRLFHTWTVIRKQDSITHCIAQHCLSYDWFYLCQNFINKTWRIQGVHTCKRRPCAMQTLSSSPLKIEFENTRTAKRFLMLSGACPSINT